MQISIALATYNGTPFLDEQLASFVAQARRPNELVVSDDGSTDYTLAIIDRFAATAPFPVRIVRAGKRLGFADNFLFAAQNCRHELVAFSDQDDVWHPEKLEEGHRRLKNDDSLLALHRLTLTDGALRPIGDLDQGIVADAVFEPLHLDPYTTGWGNTLLFRRALLDLIPSAARPDQPGMAKPLSHDTWIYVLAAALGRVSHIHSPLILYRQHGSNAVGKAAATLRTRLAAVLRDPTAGYREKVVVDTRLADLFADLTLRSEGEMHERAAAAAERYRRRVMLFQQRIAAYLAPSLPARLRAHRSAIETARGDEAAAARLAKVKAKDLALGVSGLVRAARRWTA